MKQTNSTGTWFFLTMFLIFMTLKLTGYISWSWLWVTAPLWGPLAVVVVGMILVLIIASILEAVGNRKKSKFGVNKNK